MRTAKRLLTHLLRAVFSVISLALGLVLGIPFFLIAASPFIG